MRVDCSASSSRLHCASVLTALCMVASAGIAPGVELPFDHLSQTSVSLPSESVQWAHQDSLGFVWLGFFSSGLGRYDGHSLELYGMSDGMADITVRDILEDGQGFLWVGSETGVVVSDRPLDEYAVGERVRFRSTVGGSELVRSRIRHNWITTGPDGSIWVATADQGLYHYTSRRDGALEVEVIPLEGLQEARNSGGCVEVLSDGTLWLALESGPVAIVASGQQLVVPLPESALPPEPISVLRESDSGTLWAGCFDGSLWRWNDVARKFVPISEILGEQVISLLENGGELWATTVGDGVLRLSTTGMEEPLHITRRHGLPNETVWRIMRDHEGTLWFCHNAGLSKLRADYRAFGHLTGYSRAGEPPLLPEPTVFSVLPPSQKAPTHPSELLWVGTGGGVAAIANGLRAATLDTSDGLQSSSIYALYRDQIERIWIGTQLGMSVLTFGPATPPPPLGSNGTDLIEIAQHSATLSRLDTDTVYACRELLIDRESEAPEPTLWICGTDGLFCLLNGRWITFRSASGLPPTGTAGIALDPRGRIWACSKDRGVFRSSGPVTSAVLESLETAGGEVVTPLFEPVFNASMGAPTSNVNNLIWAGDRIWVGTAAGVHALEPDSAAITTSLGRDDGLGGGMVMGMAVHPRTGHLWITQNEGIAEIDPASATVVRTVTKADGLVHNESWVGASLAIGPEGTIYHATPKGVSLYRPSLDWSNPQPPILRLRQFELSESLSGHNQVVIEYAALSFVDEQRVRYRTRLLGYDTTWSELTHDTRIRYTNLNAVLLPRQYTLEVVAANDAGVWTDQPLSVSFAVQPAWWLTWWAGALYVVALMAVAITVDSIRNLRLKRRTVELGEQVELRTAEIRSHIQELETLDEIVATINREKGLEKVMETLLEQGLVLLPQASQGAFVLRDEERDLFEVVAVYGWDRDELSGVWFSVDEALSRYVEGTEKVASGVYLVHDAVNRPGADKVEHLGSTETMLTIDLPLSGKIFGLLVFELMTPLRTLRANDVRKLIRYRQHAISALDKALVLRQLERKSREAEQANRAKSAFLANMSHELRTPLNSIIGFSEVLLHKLKDDTDDRSVKFLSNILASGHHLLALINDLLDLSKIEAGKMELDLEEISLPQLVNGVTAVIQGIAKKRRIVIEQDLSPKASRAHLDPSKVKQILYNLLSNAIKFSPEASTVTIRSRFLGTDESPLGEPSIVIEVADRGIGIAAEEQQRIFDEFQQLDDTSSRQYVGTGLGLALVRRYIEMLGGTIELESAVGVGSTFTVVLPADASRHSTADD